SWPARPWPSARGLARRGPAPGSSSLPPLPVVAEGAAEELHGMEHLELEALPPALLRDLQEAAGVAAHHRARAGLPDALDLPARQLPRHLRLLHIVDPSAAAAELAVRQLDETEVGDPAQQRAGLRSHPLSVHEVAGVVIGHRHR